MAIASTATQSEMVDLYLAVAKVEVALRQFNDGSATDTDGNTGRFATAELDTLIGALNTALTAVLAGA